MHILILAGGEGARLWPLSRQDFPKQFLKFGREFSLLQTTVTRALLCPLQTSITLITSAQHEFLIRKQLHEMEAERKVTLLIEPHRRNTAPAIALGVQYLKETQLGRGTVLVLPSDHCFEPPSLFIQGVERVAPLLERGGLYLFGIVPTRPETGFGYIRIAPEEAGLPVQRVAQFVEKPNLERAKAFIETQQYYWNSGMFAFSLPFFFETLLPLCPPLHTLTTGSFTEMAAHFHQMPNISFDYAIAEKCQQTFVSPLSLLWSDVGSWDSVYEMMEKDAEGNAKAGNVCSVGTKQSLIFGGKRLISTLGIEELLIIETDEALFIAKKGESQRVRELVETLVKRGQMPAYTHPRQTQRGEKVSLVVGETHLLAHRGVLVSLGLHASLSINGREHTFSSLEVLPIEEPTLLTGIVPHSGDFLFIPL